MADRDAVGRLQKGHSIGAETQFKPGNQVPTKHGGRAAIETLRAGEPLTGIARQLQENVHDRIETDGLLAVMRESAERHQAIADLYYGLLLGAKDVAGIDEKVKRYGWLNAGAFRMFETIRQAEQAAGASGELMASAMAAADAAGGEDDP